MTDYLIVNGTSSQLTNVNAGGDDIPALTVADGVALTAAEAETLLATQGVAIVKTNPSYVQRRAISRILKYRKSLPL